MPYINHDDFCLHPVSEYELPFWADRKKKHYKVVNELIYKDPLTGKKIIIPKGFYTDGASIPRWLWSVTGSPFAGNYIEAAVIHDFLYHLAIDKKLKLTTRKHADDIFYQCMLEYGVPEREAKIKYRAVRLFGPRW